MPRYDYPPSVARRPLDVAERYRCGTSNHAGHARKPRPTSGCGLIRTQIRMGLDAVDQGRLGSPRAYVIPSGQRDPGAVYTLTEGPALRRR